MNITPESLKQQGNDYFDQLDYEQAYKYYTEALKLNSIEIENYNTNQPIYLNFHLKLQNVQESCRLYQLD